MRPVGTRVERARSLSTILGGLVLAAYFFLGTMHAQGRPGANVSNPQGWWGWFDQSRYLRSVDAFARFDFAAARHWYPLGYPLLGAPFVRLMPLHPFLVVDLTCLLGSYAGFVVFARGCGFSGPVAVAAFLIGAIGSEFVRGNWVIPWTTTPAAAAIWMFLALRVRQLAAAPGEPQPRRWRRIMWIGALAAAAPLFRPADLLMPATGLTLMLWWGLTDRSLRAGDPLALLIGAAVLLIPYGLLYVHIYGAHPSPYMTGSRAIGFRLSELPLKTVWLLISPRPWFPSGTGLLERLPWIAAGFAGMLLHGRAPCAGHGGMTMLALMMLSYMALFFSYVDLLPSGLWRYDNVHYFKWLLPGFALFGVVFLRALLLGPRRRAVLALGAVLLLSGIRLVPVPVQAERSARMLQFASRPPAWTAAYMGHEQLSDQVGVFDNIRTMRVLPDSQGLRVISLSRPFDGRTVWRDRSNLAIATDVAAARWGLRVGYGWPCWLPPYPCQRMPPAP